MLSSAGLFSRQIWGNSVESYCWFFGIILFILVFQKYISKILSRLLFHVFRRFAADIESTKFVELMVRPIGLLIMLITLYLAINQLQFPLDEKIFSKKSWTYLSLVDKAFLLSISISFTWIILRIIDFVALVLAFKASLTESKMDDQLVPFFKEASKIIVVLTSIFVILGTVFEVNVASLIAGLGIGGLALALAAKESLENLLASFTIFLDKPFVVGDLVKVDMIEGTIEKVGFRSTRIRTTDKSIITVPNKKMVDGALDNLTLRTFRRVKFNLGISYRSSKESIKVICEDIQSYIDNHPHTSNDGVVVFETFGEYALNILVLYYIGIMEYNDYLKIKEEINFKIMDIVKQHGAEIALPTRLVYSQDSD